MADRTDPSCIPLRIVRFCAVECELQRSGEVSVAWMAEAWFRATHFRGPLTVPNILELGRLVEPDKNRDGYRECAVRVGWDVKPDWQSVPPLMLDLLDTQDDVTPEEWFHGYEEIHPFVDGNGRTGVLLYNWLKGCLLDDPVWPPNFWHDPRRVAGYGAP